MSDHTIISIDDVENSAEAFGLAPGLDARFASKDLDCKHAGISFQKLAPGFRVPFGHAHPEQEELYVIVKGDGRVKLDDDVKDVRERDVIRIGAGVKHGIEAGANGLELIAFGAPGPLRGDAEMDQEWWADEPTAS